MGSIAKSSNLTVLVDRYTKRLKNYLKTGKGKPDPNLFMNKYATKANRRELQLHLNMTTLLVMYGADLRREAQKALKKRVSSEGVDVL
jgi:hypothetical protein